MWTSAYRTTPERTTAPAFDDGLFSGTGVEAADGVAELWLSHDAVFLDPSLFAESGAAVDDGERTHHCSSSNRDGAWCAEGVSGHEYGEPADPHAGVGYEQTCAFELGCGEFLDRTH
jgi:hypothetical protein